MKFSKIINIILVLVIIGFFLNKVFRKPKYENGEVAPDFTIELIDGTTMQLSDLRGQFVLLDFWGSWCGPCRAENPQLVQLYTKYYQKKPGLEIISIGIENNEERWKRAIKSDGLFWKYHSSDLKRFQSEVGNLYGVKEIPTKYLISEEGKIIGVNLPFDQLDKLLNTRNK